MVDISTVVVDDGVIVKGVDSAWKNDSVLFEVPSGFVVDVVFTIVVTFIVVFVDIPVVVVVLAIVRDGVVVQVAFVSAVVKKLLVVGLSTVLEAKI